MPRYLEVVFNIPLNRAFSYLNCVDKRAKIGTRVSAPFGRRKAVGFVISGGEELPKMGSDGLKEIYKAIDAEALFGAREVELALWMSEHYFCSVGEAIAAMLPGGRRETPSAPALPDDLDLREKAPVLTDEQSVALASIRKAKPGSSVYLFGLTGSGKTEVFLAAAREALAEGKGVIYLVPEISLTHQVIDTVTKRLADVLGPKGKVAVLHSGMTPSQRLSEWRALMRGEARVAIGARSAVFAPIDNLGLVILDEEHEASYKAGNAPRYHARQVAMRRCQGEGARLVMGSATPSVEAWQLASEGKIELAKLTQRPAGGSMPEIRVVSMRGRKGCFSRELVEEVRKTKALGRQSILFLNRRGFSHFFHCQSCGYELLCKNCSVSLTYHKSRGGMVCHYCGYSEPLPKQCPSCGSLDSGFAGYGTEMIEAEATRVFSDCVVRRVDTDSTQTKGSLQSTLEEFKAGKIDILLGTQMVAKGLNFPGLRFVGVVLADTSLHLPDFRAAERTFSLITQVAGRAGRYFPDGLVIVQTLMPENPAIDAACRADIEGFYNHEIEMRKDLGFPPFTRLIRVTARSKNKEQAESAIDELAEIIHSNLPAGDSELLGPSECPIGMIAGNHRYQLLLRASKLGPIGSALKASLRAFKIPSSTYIEVDVDPMSLL